MRLRPILYILLLATLLTGCDERPTIRRLEQLEERIESAPDSVLAVLSQTPPPRQGERQALYALLTILAQEKAGIAVKDDSLIHIAMQYYSRRGAPAPRLHAYYCQGRIYANSRQYRKAMMAYTRA